MGEDTNEFYFDNPTPAPEDAVLAPEMLISAEYDRRQTVMAQIEQLGVGGAIAEIAILGLKRRNLDIIQDGVVGSNLNGLQVLSELVESGQVDLNGVVPIDKDGLQNILNNHPIIRES